MLTCRTCDENDTAKFSFQLDEQSLQLTCPSCGSVETIYRYSADGEVNGRFQEALRIRDDRRLAAALSRFHFRQPDTPVVWDETQRRVLLKEIETPGEYRAFLDLSSVNVQRGQVATLPAESVVDVDEDNDDEDTVIVEEDDPFAASQTVIDAQTESGE